MVFFLIFGFSFSCTQMRKESRVEDSTGSGVDSVSMIIKNSPNKSLRVGEVIQTIGFGSCMDQNYPQPIWATLKKENLDLFIATGDIVYASLPKDKPISKAYLRQIENSDLNNFRAMVPWIGVWDDHDFGVNDGGGDHPEFEEAKRHLHAFLPNSSKVTPPNQKGIYHSVILGNKPKTLQVILLDTRTFRSPLASDTSGNRYKRYRATLDTNSTILGDEQWAWLETELQKPANFRILVSSIQVLPDQHGFEKWGNFPHERKRLLSLLERYKLKNLIIVSGDRHFSETSQLKLNKKKSLLEFTSSGLNKSSQLYDEQNSLRIGKAQFAPNFGILTIDYMKRTANYQVRSQDGQTVHEHLIHF